MMNSFARIALSVSIGMNIILFIGMVILDARISKLESKHYDSSPLEIDFGFNTE